MTLAAFSNLNDPRYIKQIEGAPGKSEPPRNHAVERHQQARSIPAGFRKPGRHGRRMRLFLGIWAGNQKQKNLIMRFMHNFSIILYIFLWPSGKFTATPQHLEKRFKGQYWNQQFHGKQQENKEQQTGFPASLRNKPSPKKGCQGWFRRF